MHHKDDLSLLEIKIKATRLLKQLRSESLEQAMLAALRFRKLRAFWQYPLQDLLLIRNKVKHKHALTVLALEHHYASWAKMKQDLEKQEVPQADVATSNLKEWAKLLLPKRCHGFLNHWFADYASAKACQQTNNGYLFPFGDQFFVATETYLTTLGLDPQAKDILTLEGDFARPKNARAYDRILRQLNQQATSVA